MMQTSMTSDNGFFMKNIQIENQNHSSTESKAPPGLLINDFLLKIWLIWPNHGQKSGTLTLSCFNGNCVQSVFVACYNFNTTLFYKDSRCGVHDTLRCCKFN